MSFCKEAKCVSPWRKRTRVSPRSSRSVPISRVRFRRRSRAASLSSLVPLPPPHPCQEPRPPRQVGERLRIRPAGQRDRAPAQARVRLAPRASNADEAREPTRRRVAGRRSALEQQKDDERNARERRQPGRDVQAFQPISARKASMAFSSATLRSEVFTVSAPRSRSKRRCISA